MSIIAPPLTCVVLQRIACRTWWVLRRVKLIKQSSLTRRWGRSTLRLLRLAISMFWFGSRVSDMQGCCFDKPPVHTLMREIVNEGNLYQLGLLPLFPEGMILVLVLLHVVPSLEVDQLTPSPFTFIFYNCHQQKPNIEKLDNSYL
jgi:hypothetical protein